MKIVIAAEFQTVLRLAWVLADGATVRPREAALAAEIDALVARITKEHAGAEPSTVPGIARARRLFHAIGLDPTRYRPSSEALFRRISKGQGLYAINNVVDALNLHSLETLFPMGLYDADHVDGDATARKGRAGETYEGIGRGPQNLEGKPVLVDAKGPFGSPTSDSTRSMVRETTKRVLWVIFTPSGTGDAELELGRRRAEDLLSRHCGARVVERG